MGLADLTPEQRKLIERVEANKPGNQSLQVLQDIAVMNEELIRLMDTSAEKGDKFTKELGAVLVDMRASLDSLNKKETPESPDYAKPVVERLKQLETALTSALKKIDVKPVVNPPQVNVDVPHVSVDLKGVEKVLKEMPGAFKEAIKLVPKTEIPEQDNSDIVDQLREMSDKLDDINTGTRMKPQFPTTLKVTNPDGTEIGDGFVLGTDYDYTGFSNPDANGNYQNITYKLGGSGGTSVRTLSLAYDGNNNVTSIQKI